MVLCQVWLILNKWVFIHRFTLPLKHVVKAVEVATPYESELLISTEYFKEI